MYPSPLQRKEIQNSLVEVRREAYWISESSPEFLCFLDHERFYNCGKITKNFGINTIDNDQNTCYYKTADGAEKLKFKTQIYRAY